jgi:two-component system, chemotaxis family, response regulator Rcp1
MAHRVEILLVEDTPSDVRLTQEALKDSSLDYNLEVVNDGVQAVEYLKKVANSDKKPDIILLDLNMPKKNGHEVLADLKTIKEFDDVTVILLTVSRDEEDIHKALDLKMHYYLGKPVTSEKLNALLQAMDELHSDHETKSKLSGEDAHIRYVIAGNPHTSAAVLEKLSKEKSSTIRSRVAENPNAPLPLLKQLAQDEDPEVRMAVAENEKAPADLLEKLAHDEHEDVRLGLASNPNCPANILKQLAADENPHIVAAANSTLSKAAAR